MILLKKYYREIIIVLLLAALIITWSTLAGDDEIPVDDLKAKNEQLKKRLDSTLTAYSAEKQRLTAQMDSLNEQIGEQNTVITTVREYVNFSRNELRNLLNEEPLTQDQINALYREAKQLFTTAPTTPN